MVTIAVPYHLDERLDALDVGLPVDDEVTATLSSGGPWERMTELYESVAEAVAGQDLGEDRDPLLVVSGDCTTSLGVLAGLQRAGHDVGIVWLDAHADVHTEGSTTSGYLGGMPVALAVGVGTPTLPTLLGVRAVPEARAVLVDARDTDPGEHELLGRSEVSRIGVLELAADVLPDGPLYLHVDADVCDATDVPGLLYPVWGGPSLDGVLAALRRVVQTGRVVAVGIAATWSQGGPATAEHEHVVRRLQQAVSPGCTAGAGP